MKDRIKDFIRVALMVGVCVGGMFLLMQLKGKADTPHPSTPPPPVDTTTSVPAFLEKSAKEGLKEALRHYDIICPEIVYAQAVLETGHFKSVGCLKHHNLFGLYDTRQRDIAGSITGLRVWWLTESGFKRDTNLRRTTTGFFRG